MLKLFQPKCKDSPLKTEREILISKIVTVLKCGQSLYIKGEAGSGKTWICNTVFSVLRKEGIKVAVLSPGSVKEILVEVAEQFGIDTTNENDKPLSTNLLKLEVTDFLKCHSCILICDNLPQIPSALRLWLDNLYTEGQTILGTGKTKPEKDLIFKLVAYELEPISALEIKSIALEQARKLGVNTDVKELAVNCGGNPGTLIKLLKKSAIAQLGLCPKEETEPVKTRSLQNVIILGIMALALCRYVGKDPLLFAAGGSMVVSRIVNVSLRYKKPS